MPDTAGMTGDRRRNPFPAFSDAEYELFRAQMREEARKGAEAAIAAHLGKFCAEHRERTESLEAAVFGRTESNLVGMDERLRGVERSLGYAAKALWIVIGAFIVAVVGLIFGRA